MNNEIPSEFPTSRGGARSVHARFPETPSLPPLDRFEGTLARRVYLSLRKAIIRLDFAPGERLRLTEICEALGVSRSPLSEAIARLATDRLVEVLPQSGSFVSRLSMTEVRQEMFIREALELAAIEQVVQHVSDDQVRLLRRNMRVQQAMLEDKDHAGFYEHDAQMHELILSFTGHHRLHEIAASARAQVDRVRHLVLPPTGYIEDAYREHQAIVDAIEKRDPRLARQALRHHLDQLFTRLDRIVREQPDLFQGGDRDSPLPMKETLDIRRNRSRPPDGATPC